VYRLKLARFLDIAVQTGWFEVEHALYSTAVLLFGS
jgi:hypothetical protein